jgi:hypothetical protein
MRVIVVLAELSNSFRESAAEVGHVEHRATLSANPVFMRFFERGAEGATHSLWCFSPMKADSSKYGRTHQNERRRWQSEVDAGRGACAICGRPIDRRAHWSLIRDLGPAHTRCGFVEGKLGKTTSRDW